MLITPSNLNLLFTDVDMRFWQAYGTALPWYQKIATTYPCGTEQMVFGWMGMLNRPRRWDGPRTLHSPAPQTYVVIPELFELTESLDQQKIQDDQFGVFMQTVNFMGESMRKWPDFELRDLLKNQGIQTGSKQNGLDTGTHWNTAHPVDFYDSAKGNFCNDYSGGVSVGGILTGGALSPNAFATVWQDMASRKSEMGEPLGIIPNLSVYAPQQKLTADLIMQAQFFAPDSLGNLQFNVGSTDNVLKQFTDGLMIPDFAADPNVWYMLCTNRGVMPFGWVLREAPDFVYRIAPDDPVVFDTHSYVYGSKCRATPSWSHAFLSSKSGP